MKTIHVPPQKMDKQDDWRPAIYLSGGAILRGMGAEWPTLGDLAKNCIEGWRVSRNPAALNFDPMVKTTPVYRLRNIQPHRIATEPDHLSSPRIKAQPFCVEPLDLIIRKVGNACAAMVTASHGRHPVDANLGIIRGLSQAQAVWVCFCLNQPLYQDYLNESDVIGTLVRLGLKKIKQMPVCSVPDAAQKLAPLYVAAYTSLVDTQQMLAAIRQQVKTWCSDQLAGFDELFRKYSNKCRGHFFNPRYISHTLHVQKVEQEFLRIQLMEQYGLKSISDLAVINPVNDTVNTRQTFTDNSKVLQITNISEHLTLKFPLQERTHNTWRTQNRAVCQRDVLMSTFAENARVAYLDAPPRELIYPSGQIAALRFHNHPGAYALLMESPIVRMQLERLASSGGLRFIPSGQLDKVVLPQPDPATANVWHEKVVMHHEKSRDAEKQLDDILQQMGTIFNAAHSISQNTINPNSIHRLPGKGDSGT